PHRRARLSTPTAPSPICISRFDLRRSSISVYFVPSPLPMQSASLSDEIDSMEDSLVRSRFSDKLASRRGAWVSLGIVLIPLVVLFGLFSGFQSPSQNAQAPVDSESS